MDELRGRNCVVTGASRGLGEQIAATYWAAGASLMLTARTGGDLERVAAALPPRPDQRVSTFAADLADPSAPAAILSAAQTAFPALDVLVNNAAVQGPIGAAWENDWDNWLQAMWIDLLAPAELAARAIPWMAEGGRGKIINLSGGGAASARPRFSAYATAKAALVRYTETLAEECRDLGIDVNCVAPGAMDTSLLDAVRRAGQQAAGEDEVRRAQEARSMGPETIRRAAALCLFLASPASDGISGKLISAVWDPWEELASHRQQLGGTDVYTLRRILPKDRGWDWGERGR